MKEAACRRAASQTRRACAHTSHRSLWHQRLRSRSLLSHSSIQRTSAVAPATAHRPACRGVVPSRLRSLCLALVASSTMASRLDSQLIPTRFLLTMAHFIAVLMVFYTKQNNIRNSLAIGHTTGDYDEATATVLAAVWMSIICLAVEFAGLLMGVSMFMVTLNGFGQQRRMRRSGGAAAESKTARDEGGIQTVAAM